MSKQEVRKRFGTLRGACEWYGKTLRMSKIMTSKELEIPTSTLYNWIHRHGLADCFLPQPQQRHECRGKGSRKPGSGNRTAIRLNRRQPIRQGDLVWYPGEPMHHYLFQRRKL